MAFFFRKVWSWDWIFFKYLYLKTHSCILAAVGIRSEVRVCLWGEARSRDWTRCFSRISRIRSLELDVDSLFSSTAFLEASSAASRMAMASSFNSCNNYSKLFNLYTNVRFVFTIKKPNSPKFKVHINQQLLHCSQLCLTGSADRFRLINGFIYKIFIITL